MKKLLTTLILFAFLALALAPAALACGDDQFQDVMTTYNGKSLDWYNQKYYQVVSIKKGFIIGENQTDLKDYKVPAKYLEKGTKITKGDYIMVLSNPDTKKIVTIMQLDME
jgi:hypothetical protein